MEVWIDCAFHPEFYEVSNMGRIRTKLRDVWKPKAGLNKKVKYTYKPRILKGGISNGYRTVHLGVNGKRQSFRVHRLALESFVGPCPENMEGCHSDGNKQNNKLTNLRWDTHLNNNRDRKKHGNYKTGTDHHFSKFSAGLIAGIQSGVITRQQAYAAGVSQTHYYRILRGDR